jgi:hypothetical protein
VRGGRSSSRLFLRPPFFKILKNYSSQDGKKKQEKD